MIRSRTRVSREAAFTLIELLMVIAVIAILAAILIPTIASVRFSASRTKTKILFSQWASAIEAFRQEYGVYPAFDASAKVNGGASTSAATLHAFHDLLAGRRRDGSALPARTDTTSVVPPPPENQNTRRIAFLNFTSDELFSETEPDAGKRQLLHEAFGNTDIAVLVDRNLDGKIDAADYATLPAVTAPESSSSTLRPLSADFPVSGVRAGVLFYCAPPKASDAAQLILSWK
jgi:prepilin-type N-terminal cleavage/methylation domain-containing protein